MYTNGADHSAHLPPVLKRVRDEIAENARHIAENSQKTEVDEDLVAELENNARGVAFGLHQGPFAPETNSDDEFRRQQDDDDQRLQKEADDAEAFALGAIEERKDALASLPVAGPEPVPSLVAAAAAVVVIAVSLGISISDRFLSGVPDLPLRWTMAFGISAFPAVLVVAMILFAYKSGERSVSNIIGIVGGVGVGIAGFLIRISDRAAGADWTVTGGLAILELSAVALLEGYAMRIRSAFALWNARTQERERAQQIVRLAEDAHAERVRRLQVIRERRLEYRQYLEERRIRALGPEKLQEVTVSAVRPAYLAGIAANRRVRVGALRRTP